jgi:hypothetical protein
MYCSVPAYWELLTEHHRQHVVSDQSQAKTKQGSLGIAQRIDVRMEVRFEVLEGGLQVVVILEDTATAVAMSVLPRPTTSPMSTPLRLLR